MPVNMTSTTPMQNGKIESKTIINNNGTTVNNNLSVTTINQHQTTNSASAVAAGVKNNGLNINNPLFNGYNNSNKKPIPSYPASTSTPPTPQLSSLDHYAMSRNIKLNGGNELRIDDKNISLHLNNPFVTNFTPITQPQSNLSSNNTTSSSREAAIVPPLVRKSSNDGIDSVDYAVVQRPKRPHSIAVTSTLNSTNNDFKASIALNVARKTGSNLKLNELNQSSPHKMNVPMFGRIGPQHQPQTTPSPSRYQPTAQKEFNFYTPPSPITNMNQMQQPPISQHGTLPPIVQRRSQSTPRPLANMNQMMNGSATLQNRPRSLDRSNGFVGRVPPVPRRQSQPQNFNRQPNIPPNIGMRPSATFHGQIGLQQQQSDIPPDLIATGARKKDRPMSFAYGTLPEQVYLENQLRIYSEQLRSITESVRKYSEQAKLLSELRKQQMMQKQMNGGVTPVSTPSSTHQHSNSTPDRSLPLSKSDNKICPNNDEIKTPSHQLKLFLDSIRSSMKNDSIELSEEDDISEDDEEEEGGKDIVKDPPLSQQSTPEIKTPSDQLRQFLDAIRSNQVPEHTTPTSNARIFPPQVLKIDPIKKPNEKLSININDFNTNTSDTFSQVTDNLRILNEDLESFTKSTDDKIGLNNFSNQSGMVSSGGVMNTSFGSQSALYSGVGSGNSQTMDLNHILDNFHQIASKFTTREESLAYLKKCSDALKLTTAFHGSSGGGAGSSDDSSCSTTPGSIREAVQNLLAQPRNGVQIMDDRMKLFIEIMDSQDRFSQVS